MRKWAALAALLPLLGCMPDVEPIVACGVRDGAKPLCGYQNPEDLVALPGGHALLVSEFAGMEAGGDGLISRLDLDTEKRTELFRAGQGSTEAKVWGDPDCPGAPAAFSPHGIDLVRREDDRYALLVVNHAGRESIEYFEVLDPEGAARVEWRGCVVPAETPWLNDVAALRDGGFLASRMMPRRGSVGQAWELVKAILFGVESGHVIEWSPAGGNAIVPGSQTVFPNGVLLSPDESAVFVNSTIGGKVRGIERATGRVIGEAEIASPDNSSWAADGRLLVASLTAAILEIQACNSIERGACPASFEIVALDPESFATEVVYASDGVTMGAGTVGLQVGDDLFVGSFAGDRILRVRIGGDR